MIPDEKTIMQILSFCRDLVYISPEYYMITTTDTKIIIKCCNVSHTVQLRAELPKLTDWNLQLPIRLEKIDVIKLQYKPKIVDVNKSFKEYYYLTLYDKEMITPEGYSEHDSRNMVLKFNRLTENSTNDLLVRCNGYGACFNPYFLEKLFYTIPDELHCKLLHNDSPLIVKYTSDNILVYGIVAPKLIPHDSDYLDIIEV